MKKVLLFVLIAMFVFVVACQKAIQKDAGKKAPETAGEAIVDSVGNDLNNINNVEKDLSTDELNELDSGLADIENI